MSLLTPIKAEHADALYILLKESNVTDTLLWDGPSSLEDLRSGFATREMQMAEGKINQFTVKEPQSGVPIGGADLRVQETKKSGEIGLWIGEPFQGKGIGTKVVLELVAYGFETFGLKTISAAVFVGNQASRSIFEKCGFILEHTLPMAVLKKGVAVDEWIFRLDRI